MVRALEPITNKTLNSRKVSNILCWAIDEIFVFKVTVPVEKYTQSGVLSSPRLLFIMFTTVYLSHINISQPTQDFSRTSGKGCVGGNLTPPSGESAHQAIGKLKRF